MEDLFEKRSINQGNPCFTSNRGNSLTLEEVSKLAQGRKVTATRRAKQKVPNYLNVLKNIDKYQKDRRITKKYCPLICVDLETCNGLTLPNLILLTYTL